MVGVEAREETATPKDRDPSLSEARGDARRLAVLRREIAIGLEAAAAGRLSKITASDIADEVRRELVR
jgi:hypothetical protein